VCILYTFLILLRYWCVRVKISHVNRKLFFRHPERLVWRMLVVQSPLLLMLQKRRRYALATVLFLKRSWLCCSCIRGIPWPCVLVPIVSQLYCITFVMGLRVTYVFMFRMYVKGRSTLSVLVHWMGRNFKVSSL